MRYELFFVGCSLDLQETTWHWNLGKNAMSDFHVSESLLDVQILFSQASI